MSPEAVTVAPGIVVLFSDVGCPWATLAVHRLLTTRQRLGLDGAVHIDHRAFPLEVVNGAPTPKRTLDAEIPVVGAAATDFGFAVWQADPSEWPVTTLLALEAVEAAKEQSMAASEQLDYALRRAFFAESRCISVPEVIIDVARSCPAVDADRLAADLESGRFRSRMLEHHRRHHDEVNGSPHVFLPDGAGHHNPGIEMHWEGEHGVGFPVIDADDPAVYEAILRRAAARPA